MIVHLAAVCGGIGFNQANPLRMIADNLAMAMNLIRCCPKGARILMVGTVCSYPENCPTPFKESDLWNGYPEPTNAPYGIAKKTALAMLQASGIPFEYPILANLYGPGDNFDLESSHAIPAMIRKCLEARDSGSGSVELWGDGTPTRDLLYVDDAAEAIVRLIERDEWSCRPLNIGTGVETSIRKAAGLTAQGCRFLGELSWDGQRPNGQRRRVLDTAEMRDRLGWEPPTKLAHGIDAAISWYEGVRRLCAAGATLAP